MEKLIEQFLYYLSTERGFSPRTIEAYRHDLGKLHAYLSSVRINEASAVTRADIRGFVSSLAETNAEITKARKLSAAKSFFKYLVITEIINSNPAGDLIAPKIPHKEASYLNDEEFKRLIQTVKDIATPYYLFRDVAIVTTFLHTGIRLSELVGLTVNRVDLVSKTIRVRGKGNKERTIPLNDEVAEVLKRYLEKRPKVNTHSLFVSKFGTGLCARSVYHLVKCYLVDAGIKKDKIGVHTLRHSFGASLLSKKVNLVVIQELLGHTKLETTRRYLHINNGDLRDAVNTLSE